MKIYILRHELRTQDCSFFSPLIKKGLENSIKLIDYLKKENIDKIYCSPFIRTLQTIYPYAKEHNIKINIEYGLSEIHHPDIIAKKAVGISLPEYLAESFNYNPEYKTIIESTKIIYPEKEIDAQNRMKRVLRKVIEDNINSNYNIVLVTHQTLCNAGLRLVNKTNNNYEKGKLCLIFDSKNGWTFQPIN
jgi:2,3-bisphosphoglycerate-dependent phosphoglycerate mutase